MDRTVLKYLERYKEIVDDWNAFKDINEKPLHSGIWVNTLKLSESSLIKHAENLGLRLTPIDWCPGVYKISDPKIISTSWIHLLGLCHIQDLVSLVPILLLNPNPGERILDLCAAPGNKTVYCGFLMKNKGLVVANDIDLRRLHTVNHLCGKLGVLNVVTTCHNGINYPYDSAFFDKVLVDVPCTCEGTSRKNPSILKHCSPQISTEMSNIQKRLLERAVKLCKGGGVIVYSTCTYAPEENEAVVDYILRKYHGTVRLLPLRIPGLAFSKGLTEWGNYKFLDELKHAIRIWPHQNDTGGFFVAVLKKEKETRITPREITTNYSHGWLKEDPDQLLNYIEDKFGIDKGRLSDYVFYRKGKKKLNIVSVNYDKWPVRPVVKFAGIPFMKTQINPPKLSTEATGLFGIYAKKKVAHVDKSNLEKYLKGEEIEVSVSNLEACDERGYVIIKYDNVPCGIGFLERVFSGKALIKSMFPKGRVKANVVKHF